jgi:hypothetical protein
MTGYHFDGDPAIHSTRRHLERVLKTPQSRRWPWLAMLAGGAAFTFWRLRSRRGEQARTGDSSRTSDAVIPR